ncbi:MAG: prepilin peptidase [candidate division Zixibacteria bacterium CG_4_9_14_3_um_filter_46_8]|nr:MAG: prepilin peptidase [candidate division Zixibacteria bacterium CG_4_9_14_3_um_filter_46_8]
MAISEFEPFFPYIIIALGLIFGSFFNVLIYRLPLKKSITYPPSFCPKCFTPVKPYDNIPILSYIILKGKCRYCEAKINLRYPFVEGLGGIFFGLCYLIYGFTPQLIPALFLASTFIVITFIDLDSQIIPDKVTLPGMAAGLAFSALPGGISPADAIIGLLAGGLILYAIAFLGNAIFKKESMGGGDIKLAALIGAFLGWKAVLLTLILSSLFGSIVGIILIIIPTRTSEKRSHTIPYGPFLATGATIAMFWGNNIISLYLSTLP